MNALLIAEKKLNHATRHLSKQASPNEAALFLLAKMACEFEAAKALQGLPAGLNQVVEKLKTTQVTSCLNSICSKLAQSPQDFGFKNPAEVFNPLADDIDIKDWPNETLEEHIKIGFAISQQGQIPEYPLDKNHKIVRETFRKFADTSIVHLAEKIHREDLLIPNEVIMKLSELGCFGLSIPESYGGFQSQLDPDYLGMILVTEELSRGSLGAAGSLITRPEILARALLKGGTEVQKKYWLPKIATGEKMAAIAVTEPDFGSDVASIKVSATMCKEDWLIQGTKTWCTFAGRADVLAVLARTHPDLSIKHKGLSLFLVEKPQSGDTHFKFEQPGGGSMEGRAIPTLGYRGMHSFEVKFDRWLVPQNALVGGEAGLGKGFYLQMEGFAAGRLQTAARANGLMHAALEKAISYANERVIFGKKLSEQTTTAEKLARMTGALFASRALTYYAAENLEEEDGITLAAMAKLFASQRAEWLTREAQQIHGGMGYAEEFAVSRYFVDARVLSIFEGAEEVLAIKIIAPALLANPTHKGLSA